VLALREIEEGLVDASILLEKEESDDFIDLDLLEDNLEHAVALAIDPAPQPNSDET